MKLDPKTRLLCVDPPAGGPHEITVGDIIAAFVEQLVSNDGVAKAIAAALAPHLTASAVVRPT